MDQSDQQTGFAVFHSSYTAQSADFASKSNSYAVIEPYYAFFFNNHISDDELDKLCHISDISNLVIDNIRTNIRKTNCKSESNLQVFFSVSLSLFFCSGKSYNANHSNNKKSKQLTSTPKNHFQNGKSNLIQQLHHPSVLLKDAFMNWNTLRTHVIGLINPGNNSCYINAAIQCLASTPPLVDWLLEKNKLSTCE